MVTSSISGSVVIGSGEGLADGEEVGSGLVLGEAEGDGDGSGSLFPLTISSTPRLSMLAMAWSGKMVTTLDPAGVVMVNSLVSELIERG